MNKEILTLITDILEAINLSYTQEATLKLIELRAKLLDIK